MRAPAVTELTRAELHEQELLESMLTPEQRSAVDAEGAEPRRRMRLMRRILMSAEDFERERAR